MRSETAQNETLATRVAIGLLLFLALRLGLIVYEYLHAQSSLSNPLLPDSLKELLTNRFVVRTTLLSLGILFTGGFLLIRRPRYAVVAAAIAVLLVPLFDYGWHLALQYT
ncbi:MULTISPECIES: hypothetical protein [unclassified Flavobacterium]|uniref:hypothetical protein n=1 Tax=unclassified Flavobacterium TaxID=196869 RepID=UPI001F1480F5|nr:MULTISPECIES: hypothetical protein [unclassified Flavobacterium]UMY64981.1 hypothetical protein MKO97_10710 [Flavobacterium sp. HJ-32-4]